MSERRLLVPVDGSDHALRALQHAVELARERGDTVIHVVTVHDAPDIYGEIAVYVTPEKMAELQRRGSEANLAPARKLLDAAGVPYQAEILVGKTAEAIARRADELKCAAIVMGTRGMSSLGGFVMGSVATKVVHAASVPVTLVK